MRMKKEYLTVPNFLSLSRLVFLPVLFFLIAYEWRVAFLIGYIILGSTDYFDGLIARRFNQKTEIGKSLDSLADVFFYVSTAYFLYRLYPEYLTPNRLLLTAFFALFFMSFLISGVLLRKPIMMHTFLLKLNGVLVYFLMITSYFADTTYFIALILCIYLLGFSEEIMIFLRFGEVDPDTSSILSLMRHRQTPKHP
jgi:phosphatidylglycerophosphate synthase